MRQQQQPPLQQQQFQQPLQQFDNNKVPDAFAIAFGSSKLPPVTDYADSALFGLNDIIYQNVQSPSSVNSVLQTPQTMGVSNLQYNNSGNSNSVIINHRRMFIKYDQ
ncbi:unnamed protein product [[Candida] boidinii]|nr:unnamed protein product [[Candida] boidinii]